MNCKPNQRAIVTRTSGFGDLAAYLGMIFVVRELVQNTKGVWLWSVDPGHFHRVNMRTIKKGDPIEYVADRILTPLPDDPDPVEQDTREIEHA